MLYLSIHYRELSMQAPHLLQLVLGGPTKCFHTYQLFNSAKSGTSVLLFLFIFKHFFNFQTIFIFFTLESSSFVISYFFLFLFFFSNLQHHEKLNQFFNPVKIWSNNSPTGNRTSDHWHGGRPSNH